MNSQELAQHIHEYCIANKGDEATIKTYGNRSLS